ncbi:MAG: cbb3-type cytochrome c oxidase subunit I [Deltaproteobacteria bacterium]|nr:MAG: cbb3-type cytochrome c oxidase subunit I [Deltaproteobacteria bacterium]
MRFESQRVAYWFFAVSMLLFTLQLVYGFIMAFAHMGYDVLHHIIPFNTARTVHTNLLLMWLISGFMGAAYFIIPDETDRELIMPRLAYVQLIAYVIVGVLSILGFHYGIWEGRKFLEIPRFLDYLVVVDVLIFVLIIGGTLWSGKITTTGSVLFFGLLMAALLYLPGMIDTDNQTVDSYWRWWVVHLWVEGVWELIMGAILCYLLLKLTGVDREIVEKWLYVIVAFTFLSGILGTGHHFYWIGTPKFWLLIGGIFSALEPLAFLGMAIFGIAMARKGSKEIINPMAMYWTLGCSILSFVGAGFLGFAHTLPRVNLYTHGTLVTAMHGHLAFWGAYAMLILAMITYAMPKLCCNPRHVESSGLNYFAFWASNIGMISMTLAFAVAGVTQVYLERIYGMDFLAVQKEIEVHFAGLILAASLFTLGILSFVINFIRYGRPRARVHDMSKDYIFDEAIDSICFKGEENSQERDNEMDDDEGVYDDTEEFDESDLEEIDIEDDDEYLSDEDDELDYSESSSMFDKNYGAYSYDKNTSKSYDEDDIDDDDDDDDDDCRDDMDGIDDIDDDEDRMWNIDDEDDIDDDDDDDEKGTYYDDDDID